MTISSIGEADLHAYVDGQLDTGRRAEIEAYLAANPDAAVQVQQLRAQSEALHATFDTIMNEPIPLRLTNVLQRRAWPRGIAAGLVWLFCGAAAGWFAHASMPVPTEVTANAFAEKALVAHALYVKEKMHAVEVPAEQEAHLVAWLSKRLDMPIRAPNLQLQGFNLLGGRLLPGDSGPLAQLMYQSATGERLTLTVNRGTAKINPRKPDTAFRILEQDGMSVFYWIDGDYGYALSGSIGKNQLLAVAQLVDTQLRQSAK